MRNPMNDWRLNISLSFLNPEIVSRLLGRSYSAQKARALVMHDRLITRYPRDTCAHAENFKAEDNA